MSFPLTRYQACAGKIVGITATRAGTLLTIHLFHGQEPEAEPGAEWLGTPVEVLICGNPAPAGSAPERDRQ